MRISKIPMLVAALALGAVGCKTESGALTANSVPALGYVRYINALPDTMNTTVRFVDYLEFTPQTFVNVAFRGVAQGLYQGIKPGSRHMKIFNADVANFSTAGNTAVLADTSITFEAGKYYSLVFTGYARNGTKKLKLYEDVIPAPGANIAVRVLSPNTGLGSVDAYLVATITTAISGSPTFGAVAEQAFSAYTQVPPSTTGYAIRATAVGNAATILASAALPAGIAGTTANDPIAGYLTAGSVITAMVWPASVTGSTAAASTTPSITFIADKQPPRTTSP
jgi:hypothetical protein